MGIQKPSGNTVSYTHLDVYKRQGIHNHIEPEHLNDGDGRIDADKGADDGNAHGAEVHGQLIDDEFADAFEDGSPIELSLIHI